MIHLGTSGYSYADWKEIVYPDDLPHREWLAFYSAEFQTVELNFTYYRIPTPEQLGKLSAQTPDGFLFSVKAHQDITHNRTGDLAPFARFRAALAPLEREGKLGAVLLQFPGSLRNTKENTYYLQHCFRLLPGLPVVVEFRHNDWITKRTLDLLREWQVGFCNVDMPQLPGLLPKTAFVTAPTAYVRFHGRNEQKWWKHDQAWERYDYSYSEEELEEWVPRLLKMGKDAERLFAYANNHWQGQSVAAIRQIKMLLEHGDT